MTDSDATIRPGRKRHTIGLGTRLAAEAALLTKASGHRASGLHPGEASCTHDAPPHGFTHTPWWSMPNWGEIFSPSAPIVETFVRGTVMFLAIFALMRVIGQREGGVHSL